MESIINNLKSIYGALLIYVYDTATDIGVVIYFYQLSYDEENKDIDYESLNMNLMFSLSLAFVIIVRLIWMMYAFAMLLMKVLFPPCYCMGSMCVIMKKQYVIYFCYFLQQLWMDLYY